MNNSLRRVRTLPFALYKRVHRLFLNNIHTPITMQIDPRQQQTEPILRAFMLHSPAPIGRQKYAAMLPFEYITGLYSTLLDSGRVNFLDFNDLPFPDDEDIRTESGLTTLYKRELIAWKSRLPPVPSKFQVLIQHDCDSGPLETEYFCAVEGEVGIKSTTSLFCRQRSREGVISTYTIDFKALKYLQDEKGMCFAYHCNAFELAGYDEAAVEDIFNEDVEFLHSKGLDVKCFSPHGGVVSPDGRNNNSFFYPSFSRRRLIWTHNKFAPSGVRYSDGSWMGRIKKPDSGLDLRAFLMTKLLLPGAMSKRYIMLIHPQYYFADGSALAEKFFMQNPWLEEFWELHRQGNSSAYWDPLRAALRSVT